MSYYERPKGGGLRGEPFDVTGQDGVRRIGFKQGPSSYGYSIPENIVWELFPDGRAKYLRRVIPYRAWSPQMAGPTDPSKALGGVVNPPNAAVVPNPEAGSPAWTYEFSPDAFKVFKMAASLHQDGILENSIHRYGMIWPAWDLPFTAEDSAAMRKWIVSLSPAEAFGYYYALLLYDGDKCGDCTCRKFVPEVSPKEFQSNLLWPVFQQMVMQSIYNVRTDLHKVRDPETGNIIEGLIKWDQFTMPCKQSLGQMLVGYVGIVGQLVTGFLTLGASSAFQAASTIISTSIDIVKTVDQAKRQRAIELFTNSVIKGYSAGTDIQNILQPPPKLTPAEEVLIAKAEGKTPPVSEPAGGGKTPPAVTVTQGGTFPWLLAVGAAAALLLS
jgi:hypothetical protein